MPYESVKRVSLKGSKMKRSEQKLIAGPVEGYKIFEDDMTCRGYQFSLTEHNDLGGDEPLKAREHGFHFCESPSGVWTYYEKGRVFKIKAYGVLDQGHTPGVDYKRVCERIEIGEEILVTGDRNTGSWNCGDYHSGFFNTQEAPLYLFGVICPLGRSALPMRLMQQLGTALQIDEAIDPTPFLAIPNATAARIKTLHNAFIKARKEVTE